MRNVTAFLDLHFAIQTEWRADWACGVPMIVFTVVLHVLSLGFINQRGVRLLNQISERRHPMLVFAKVMGATTLLVTCLHAGETAIWAASIRFLGALPDFNSAMLYSLNAITSYGHENLSLEPQWQLLGAIEALNGWLLFGLTTAFLFGMIQKVSLSERSGPQLKPKPDQNCSTLSSEPGQECASCYSNSDTLPPVRS